MLCCWHQAQINSGNTDQLGNKITKGVSNQLKNKAINKTEGFVNNKANTFLNAFGAGRSEVSIFFENSRGLVVFFGGRLWIFLLVRLTKI
jgi:BioD-like phosphotransacetylase family protein